MFEPASKGRVVFRGVDSSTREMPPERAAGVEEGKSDHSLRGYDERRIAPDGEAEVRPWSELQVSSFIGHVFHPSILRR